MKRARINLIILSTYAALTVALLVGMIVVFVGSINNKAIIDPEIRPSEKVIVFNDEITLFLGQATTLSPYIMDTDGTITSSKFNYTSSCDEIVVDSAGNIEAKGKLKGDATVTITDTRSPARKVVKVNVISEIVKVKGITTPAGETVGENVNYREAFTKDGSYTLTAITKPAEADLDGLCTIVVRDDYGNVKDAFEYTIENNKIHIKPVGIGEGTMSITVINGEGREIYSKSLNFKINMSNVVISDAILDSSGKSLMLESDFNSITELTVNGTVKNMNDLSMLKSLNKLYIDSSSVVSMQNISSNVKYYVPDNVFGRYTSNGNWKDYLSNLYPYSTSNSSAKYVVYHNIIDGAHEVSYDVIDSSLISLPTYNDYNGQKFKGWKTKDGKSVTLSDVRSSSESLHIYADWGKITYTVIYESNKLKKVHSETWVYGETHQIADITDFPGYKPQKGWTFLGWTTVEGGSYVEYYPNSIVGDLTDKDGATVYLYDVWDAVEYYIVFEFPTGLPFYENLNISPLYVVSGDEYYLPTIDLSHRQGYVFSGWQTQSGKKLSPGKNTEILAEEEGVSVVLTAVVEGVQSFYQFMLNGGYIIDEEMNKIDRNFRETYRYGDEIVLPEAYCEGKTFKGWMINGNLYAAGSKYKVVATEVDMYAVEAIFE